MAGALRFRVTVLGDRVTLISAMERISHVHNIDTIVDYLIEHELARRADLVPCSAHEVAEIRTKQRIDRLPPQYECFLRAMGKKAGRLLVGTSIFYPSMITYFEEMQEFVLENNLANVVPGSVLLGTHQGYMLYWLEPGDPSGLMHVCEESDLPDPEARTWPTFFDFLMSEAAEAVRMRDSRRR